MSICNVWTSTQTAVAAVDTACTHHPGGSPGEFSKLLHIPHSNTLFAFRGEKMSALAVYFHATRASSFDEIVALVPDALRNIERERLATTLPDDVDLTLELFVQGWSDRLDRMAMAYFLYRPGEDLDYTAPDDFGSMLSPCDEDTTRTGLELPFVETDDLAGDVRALVETQIAYGREQNPETRFGGRLLVTLLDRYSLRFMDLGALA